MADIKVTIIDREGQTHVLEGPTDMNMNIMELCSLRFTSERRMCRHGHVRYLSVLPRIGYSTL